MGIRASIGGTGKRNGHRLARPVRGLELLPNGDFSGGATGWTLGTGWTVSGGQLVATAAAQDTFAQSVGGPLVAGNTYEINITCTSITAGGWKLVLEGGTNVFGDLTTTGSYRGVIVAASSGSIYIWSNSALTATFDDVSVRQTW